MATTTALPKIAFIGLGIMGGPMAENLQRAGYELSIFARHKERVAKLIASGMEFHDTIEGAVEGADVTITIVGFPPDVEEVYFGAAEGSADATDEATGILAAAKEGSYVIDMTTSSPTLAQKIAEAARKRGLHPLDAPVTGGDIGAQAGTLSIMVGGDKADYEACLPIFRAMGTSINYMGESGLGQHTKMANQIMIAGAMAGVCEGLTYAKAKGLDLATVVDAVKDGSAGGNQLSGYAPRILRDDWTPGFKIEHFVKDMRIARREAEDAHLDLDMLRQVLLNYEELLAKGLGGDGTQALMKFYQSGD